MAMNKGINREDNKEKKDSAFVDHVVSLRRVTKVTKGGKRFSFRITVVIGDGKYKNKFSADTSQGMVSRFIHAGVAIDEILFANNSLGLDTRVIGAAGFPITRELRNMGSMHETDKLSGRLLVHQLN